MTLKKFEICSLPQYADIAIVPGGVVTPDNMKRQTAEIDINLDKGMEL